MDHLYIVVNVIGSPVIGSYWGKVLYGERCGSDVQAALSPRHVGPRQHHRDDRASCLQCQVNETLHKICSNSTQKSKDICCSCNLLSCTESFIPTISARKRRATILQLPEVYRPKINSYPTLVGDQVRVCYGGETESVNRLPRTMH